MKKKIIIIALIVLLIILFSGCSALGGSSKDAGSADNAGNADSGIVEQITGGRSQTVDILLLITVLSVLPSILIMLTCFPRIIIVLSLIRNGLGLQQMPPNQVLVGLALFLTFFVMSPVTEEEALDRAMEPVREFMLKQTFKEDLNYFISVSDSADEVQVVEDVPNHVLIPAFMTSEIKRGFEMGFFLYIPFIVIDMIVASVLMSMGMMMLPPIVISLPFKLLLFVLVDGWMLSVKTLISSFG